MLTPRAVFEHQTVAGLAGVAGLVAAGSPVLPEVAVGSLAATPIMRWLAERGGSLDRFHQAVLLRLPGGVQEQHLVTALFAPVHERGTQSKNAELCVRP